MPEELKQIWLIFSSITTEVIQISDESRGRHSIRDLLHTLSDLFPSVAQNHSEKWYSQTLRLSLSMAPNRLCDPSTPGLAI